MLVQWVFFLKDFWRVLTGPLKKGRMDDICCNLGWFKVSWLSKVQLINVSSCLNPYIFLLHSRLSGFSWNDTYFLFRLDTDEACCHSQILSKLLPILMTWLIRTNRFSFSPSQMTLILQTSSHSSDCASPMLKSALSSQIICSACFECSERYFGRPKSCFRHRVDLA